MSGTDDEREPEEEIANFGIEWISKAGDTVELNRKERERRLKE